MNRFFLYVLIVQRSVRNVENTSAKNTLKTIGVDNSRLNNLLLHQEHSIFLLLCIFSFFLYFYFSLPLLIKGFVKSSAYKGVQQKYLKGIILKILDDIQRTK